MVNQTVPSAAAAIAMGASRVPGMRYSTKRAAGAAHRNNSMPAALSTTSPSAALIAIMRRQQMRPILRIDSYDQGGVEEQPNVGPEPSAAQIA